MTPSEIDMEIDLAMCEALFSECTMKLMADLERLKSKPNISKSFIESREKLLRDIISVVVQYKKALKSYDLIISQLISQKRFLKAMLLAKMKSLNDFIDYKYPDNDYKIKAD